MFDELVLMFWGFYALYKKIKSFFKRALSEKGGKMCPPNQEDRFLSEESYGDYFRNHVLEHILPFWERYSVDENYGGFITHIGRDGTLYRCDVKYTGMQGRMVYGLSLGYGLGGNRTYLTLASSGVQFLIEHLWDKKFGGWYWSSDRDGKVRDNGKHSFGEAYAMLGLSEFYRATSDETALKYAEKTYELMDVHGWDKQYLGYYEDFHRDWSVKSIAKILCIQIEMGEAIRSLYFATKNEAYRKRLIQIGEIIIGHTFNKKYGCVMRNFHKDWSYNPLCFDQKINLHFGYNFKYAWFLLRLYELVKDETYYTHAKKLIEYCLKYGWDVQNNGFYGFAYRGRILANTDKIWWIQCEGILSLLFYLYRLAGDRKWYDYFKKTANFCFGHLFDAHFDEWFRSCYEDGTPKDLIKGGDWKAAYHTVQTCFYAHHYLKSNLLSQDEREHKL